jgi:hypothetical protein
MGKQLIAELFGCRHGPKIVRVLPGEGAVTLNICSRTSCRSDCEALVLPRNRSAMAIQAVRFVGPTVVDKQTQQICRPYFFTLHKLYHSVPIRFLIPMSSHSSEYDERIKMASATIAKILATHPFLVGIS